MNIGIKCRPLSIRPTGLSGTAAGERIAEADLHAHVTNAFINPGEASGLPRALIIGDSISIGYTDPTRNNLRDIADVFRPPENCQHTGYGLAHIKTWLGTSKWDVIHFNFGIWDTHLLDSHGNLVRAEDQYPPTNGVRIRHTPEQYRANLNQLVGILQDVGAKLIWASSTPVMSRTGNRLEAIPALNLIAAELMKSSGIAIDDLYGLVLPQMKEWQDPDQCHFNARGNEQLGKQVTNCIRRLISDQER